MRLLCLAAVPLLVAPLGAADPFEFKDGDRVVFLGSTLIEREQKYGWWELMLTLKNRDKNVVFRNLGWSGDTVFGDARNGFDESPKGFERLVGLTKELKPTVIVICYGQNESFAGKAGVPAFTAGLNKLLEALAPTKARVVLMSPTPFERGLGPLDPGRSNADLNLYRDAIRAVADGRGVSFVDPSAALRESDQPYRLTDNGVHLTPDGYQLIAHILVPGVSLAAGADALRAKIVEKNRLFFYRWRPQNETYLFGFRKNEQGRNAAEVAAFDPLVAAAEREIAELKKTVNK